MSHFLQNHLEPLKNFKAHFKLYLLTSLILQVVLAYLVKGLLSFVFNRILLFAGIVGLSPDTWPQIAHNPLALIFFILYLILLVIAILGEFTILTVVVTRTLRQISLKDVLKSSPQKIRQLLSPQVLVLLLYIFLMIPLANFGLNSTLLERFKIPDFISGELVKTSLGKLGYYTSLAVIAYLNLRLIYVLPLYILQKIKPSQALQKSWQLTKGRAQVHLLGAIIFYSLIPLIFLFSSYLLSAGIFSLIDTSGNNLPLQTLFFSLIKSANFIATIALKYFLIILLVQDLAKENQLYFSTSSPTVSAVTFPKWLYALLSLVLLGWGVSNGITLYLIPSNHQAQLIAHRGDTSHAVENSIAAMQDAHRAGAQYSEMDIVMTKDHQFVVSHDNNLKRLTGVDKNISDLTLEEVTKLKTHQNGHTDHIASFEEFMKAAQKIHQPILIELKPYDENPDSYAETFVKKLKELHAVRDNKIMSLDLKLIEHVEKDLPQADTGYLISLQFGGLPNRHVDFYAIEEFSYTNYIALQAHQQKKPLYVWTINDESLMMHFLQTPVKGIITDRLGLFKRDKKDIDDDDSYFDRSIRIINSDFLH